MAKTKLNFIKEMCDYLLARHTMSNLPFFSSEQKGKITTITEFQDLIHNHYNFQNVSLIKDLVERYGEGSVKGDFNSYVDRLREFQEETRIRDYIDVEASRKDTTELPLGFVEVKMEMGDSWNDCKLTDVEMFRRQICEKASIPLQAVIFIRVTMGSIILVWGVEKSNSALSPLLQALDKAEIMTEFDVKFKSVSDAPESSAMSGTEDVEEIEQPSHASELEEAGESCMYQLLYNWQVSWGNNSIAVKVSDVL